MLTEIKHTRRRCDLLWIFACVTWEWIPADLVFYQPARLRGQFVKRSRA